MEEGGICCGVQEDHMRPLGGWADFSEGGMALRVYYHQCAISLTRRRKFGGQASSGIPTDRK